MRRLTQSGGLSVVIQCKYVYLVILFCYKFAVKKNVLSSCHFVTVKAMLVFVSTSATRRYRIFFLCS